MKKLISIFLAAFLLCTSGILVLAANSTPEILYLESFESTATNAVPSKLTISGMADVYVTDLGKRNKALFVDKQTYSATIKGTATDTAADDVVFEVDIYRTGARLSGGITLTNGTQKQCPFSFTQQGLKNPIGKSYGSVIANKWVRLSFVLHKQTKSYDVYIDGVRKLSNWRLETPGFLGISGFEINLASSDEAATVMLDNIRVYASEKPLPDDVFPAMAYSEDEVEYVPTTKEAGTAVLMNQDFNLSVGGIVSENGNKVTLMEEKDGNRFVRYESLNNETAAVVDYSLSGEYPYLVFEADIRSSNWKMNAAQVFTLRFGSGYQRSVDFLTGGVLHTSGGATEGPMPKNRWINVAVAYRFADESFDFYVNGKCVGRNQSMENAGGYPSIVRIFARGEIGAVLDIDNLRVYEGREPHELVQENNSNPAEDYSGIAKKWPQNSEAEKLIGASDVMLGDFVFTNGKKSRLEAVTLVEERVTYISVRGLADLCGMELVWDDAQHAAILDGCVLKEGAESYVIADREIALSAPIRNMNGKLYLPVDGIGKERLFDGEIYTDWYGLVVLDPPKMFSDDEAKTIVKYMVFDRPDAAQIEQDLAAAGRKNVHPRVLADQQDFDRIKGYIETDPIAKSYYENYIKKNADAFLNEPVSDYVLSGGTLQAVSGTVRQRVTFLAMVYRITGDVKYAERAWKELESAAGFPDWNPSTFLSTGEMSAGFGIGYDWLYDYLSEEQREELYQAIERNCLNVFLSSYQDQATWTKYDSNWTFVCNGGGVMAALAVADELPVKSFALLENAMRDVENATLRYAPDGGWYEGPNYWDYAMHFYALMAGSLNSALHKDYGMTTSPGVSKTMDYMIAMEGPTGMFSYSDTGSGTTGINRISTYQSSWLAKQFNRPDWEKRRVSAQQTYNLGLHYFDMLFYNADAAHSDEALSLPLDQYFRDAEVVTSRSSWTDANALWLGYKGGYVRQSHGQQDHGSFVLDLNGERWANDWGSDNYSLPGFTSWEPATVYLQRAEAHNTIVINPSYGNDQDTYAKTKIDRFETSDAGSIGVVDMTAVYPGEAKSAVRGFLVDDMRSSVTVRDELELEKDNSTVYWFMHTAIEDETKFDVQGNTAILTGANGSKLRVEFVTDADTAEFLVMDSKPLDTSPQVEGQRNIKTKKLTIKLIGSGKVNLTVKMYDNAMAGIVPPVHDMSISNWTLPGGELSERPYLNSIYANGSILDGFSPDVTSYRIFRYYEEAEPELTFSAPEGMVVETDKSGSYIVFSVHDAENPMLCTNYRIEIKAIPHIYDTLDAFERLKVQATTVNHITDPDNQPENVNDGDLSTRYSDSSTDSWIELDLGRVTEIDAYAIAFYQGTVRDSYYDILVSEDGKNYTTLFKGSTSGMTDAYELFETPGLKLRYFQLVGHGNSVGIWNSPTEIALLRKQS